jgi:hypothetical protein
MILQQICKLKALGLKYVEIIREYKKVIKLG